MEYTTERQFNYLASNLVVDCQIRHALKVFLSKSKMAAGSKRRGPPWGAGGAPGGGGTLAAA